MAMEKDGLKKVNEKDIKQILKIVGLEKHAHLVEIFQAWEEAVGSMVAQHARVSEFTREGILTVDVDDSTWFTELRFMKKEIMEKLNRRMKNKVRSIKFRFKPAGR